MSRTWIDPEVVSIVPPVAEAEHRARAGALADMLEARPERHDQGTFGRVEPDCGTVACAAGWATLLALAVYVADGQDVRLDRTRWAEVMAEPYEVYEQLGDDGHLNFRQHNGVSLSPMEAGAAWLGLTRHTSAWLLFIGTMTERLAVAILRALAGGDLPLDFGVDDLAPVFDEVYGDGTVRRDQAWARLTEAHDAQGEWL